MTATISSCTLESLPDNVIQGTMDLEPDDPDHLKAQPRLLRALAWEQLSRGGSMHKKMLKILRQA